MKYYFVVLLLMLLAETGIFSQPVKKTTGPLVLAIWIFYGRDEKEIMRIVDSSQCNYSVEVRREGDGFTRVDFYFPIDPKPKQLVKLFKRLKRYPGMRSYATTRGDKVKEI